uniref:14-3-3 protein n=1 Tax=Rhizophora mucronata TaxID=61149 RepID=A0A2P2QWH6_RHIMU
MESMLKSQDSSTEKMHPMNSTHHCCCCPSQDLRFDDSLISSPASSRETGLSEVQSVRLSRRSCMINVLSLYDSSPNVSSSEMASSKACFARLHARSGELRIS